MTLQQDIGLVPYVKPLRRLNECVAPLRAVARQSLRWGGERRAQKRRVRRALKEPVDTVVISAEAVFRFVALNFDPRHITYDEARALGRTLRDGGAIDLRTEIAFNRGVARIQRLLASQHLDAPFNLIAVLDAYSAYSHLSWRARSQLSTASEILRTVDIRRRGLPPARAAPD